MGIGSSLPNANALARMYISLEVLPAASKALATTSHCFLDPAATLERLVEGAAQLIDALRYKLMVLPSKSASSIVRLFCWVVWLLIWKPIKEARSIPVFD